MEETAERRIRERAYQLWEARGRPIGSPLEDWFLAESLLAAESDPAWRGEALDLQWVFGGSRFRDFAAALEGALGSLAKDHGLDDARIRRLGPIAALGRNLFDHALIAFLFSRRGQEAAAQAALNGAVDIAQTLRRLYGDAEKLGTRHPSPLPAPGIAQSGFGPETTPASLLQREVAKWTHYGTLQLLAHLADVIPGTRLYFGLQDGLLDAALSVDRICRGS